MKTMTIPRRWLRSRRGRKNIDALLWAGWTLTLAVRS